MSKTETKVMKTCKEKKESALAILPRIVIIASLLFPVGSFAQGTQTQSFWSDPLNHPMLVLYVTIAFVVITILMLIAIITYLTKVVGIISRLIEEERARKSGTVYVPQPSWLQRVWEKMNATVPVTKEADIDLGHSYDGIRELDNHLPPWWKGLFYLTIVWSVFYLVFYHVIPVLPLQEDEYANELSAAQEEARIIAASRPAAVVDEDALVYDADPEAIAKGKAVFASSTCASCHRQDGGGNAIGPNLTDDYWLHGGSVKEIYRTVKNGAVEKGMPAWGKVMSATDVKSVVFYIMSLHGSNPPNAKKAQGELYKPEAPAADSLKVSASLK